MAEIDGLNELLSKLNNIVDNVLPDEVRKSVERQTRATIQAQAKLLCPVGRGELRSSIGVKIEDHGDSVESVTYTNKEYAMYVEFGTGPIGAKKHDGIAPNTNVKYKSKGWAFPVEAVDPVMRRVYSWPTRTYRNEEYYLTSGQAAQPFMYPALKNNEQKVVKRIKSDLTKKLKGACGK